MIAQLKPAVLGLILVGLYLLPALLLYFFQSIIIFPAPRIARAELEAMAAAAGATELSVPTSDGERLYGWHLRASGEKLVLYFHGNGESVAHTRALQVELVEAGWDFVSISPRGYPGSSGAPVSGSIALDAQAAWAYVTGALGFSPHQVVLHGRSLGGGLAGSLLSAVEPGGLILESTYLSLVEVGRDRFPIYPVRLLLRHRAPTDANAPRVRCPVLVLHGATDRVILPRHGRGLAALFAEAAYLEVPGFGHNDNLLQADPDAHQLWRQYLSQRAP